jgi:hypothetical protein
MENHQPKLEPSVSHNANYPDVSRHSWFAHSDSYLSGFERQRPP